MADITIGIDSAMTYDSLGGYPFIFLGNAASASGIISMLKIRVGRYAGYNDIIITLNYLISGTTYKTRSKVNLGQIIGVSTTTGLSMDVVQGDVLGEFSRTSIYCEVSGGSGIRYNTNEADIFVVGESKNFSSLASGYAAAVYGEGETESGVPIAIFQNYFNNMRS